MTNISRLELLKRKNPTWFKELDDNGWGPQVRGSVRMDRFFATSMTEDGEHTVWEAMPDGEIVYLSKWPNFDHARYEMDLLCRAQHEDVK